ncbi:MAG: hypothetical protein PVH76_08440 [Myxococcales bacterium]|jgi:hypothetical protein
MIIGPRRLLTWWFYCGWTVLLNDDQKAEWIVHVTGPMICGTGGCDTLVFADTVGGPRLVARIPLTRPPVVVATTSTHG